MTYQTNPLPASRVRVIRNGKPYPWIPPEAGPKPKERVREAFDYGADPVIPPPKGAGMCAPRRRPGRPARPVVCLLRDGTETRYGSILEASAATGVKPNAIQNQCSRGRFRESRAAVRFRYADGACT